MFFSSAVCRRGSGRDCKLVGDFHSIPPR
eukprot:COSAG01_NODE_5515_length_4208_cov_9.547578_4_plen_28_part_01